ncbi:MAG: substrate-binding domain-containing protein [Planctomycetales bacterium]|nr:substrate-binding domain-containing protein [Planctomycetales bacterium]
MTHMAPTTESAQRNDLMPQTPGVAGRCGYLSLLLLALLLPFSWGCNKSAPQSNGRLRIAVIPKSMSHVFWTSVEAGAKKAGEELDVEIIWKAPIKEDDRAQQIELVQQFVADEVSGIVLAPLDSQALVGPVKASAQAGVPVVIIDSGLNAQQGTDYISFVGTNNELGGTLGGEKLAEILGGKGDVVLLRYAEGSASTTDRERGFTNAIAQHPEIHIISDNQYAGTTSGEAQDRALNMMDALKAANGIFCPNESSTDGMLQALRKEGVIGNVKFVGFDASPPLVEALSKGEIDGLVVQNPYMMGYLGVKAMVDHLRGTTVEPVIDTGVNVVTRDIMNDPEIRPLLP